MPEAATDRLKWMPVADELRRRIQTGVYGPGTLMPSEPKLAVEFGVSRMVIRPALEQLRREGLIHTGAGRGSVVKVPAPRRTISMARYREALAVAEQAVYPPVRPPADPALAGHLPLVDISETQADAALAALFGVALGTPLSRRHLVHRIAGQPVQITTSHFLLSLVAGTWVVTPESEPCPGGQIGQLYALGVRVAQVVEEVTARYPTNAEAETLRLDGGHVLALTRRMLDADGRVVEVGREIVLPSEGSRLEYTITL